MWCYCFAVAKIGCRALVPLAINNCRGLMSDCWVCVEEVVGDGEEDNRKQWHEIVCT